MPVLANFVQVLIVTLTLPPTYSGSKNCLDVWIFITKVNSLAHLLTQALTMSV
jgi:hypothetical protein